MSAPQLRNLVTSKTPKQVAVAIGISLLGAAGWHFTVTAPKRRAYDAFYKDYDCDADQIKWEAQVAEYEATVPAKHAAYMEMLETKRLAGLKN